MSTMFAPAPPAETARATYRRMASVMLVDRIEPCLEFWVDRLGFEPRLQVANGHGLEFLVLGSGDAEVVYRTRESLHRGAPGLMEAEQHQPWVVLYLQVDDLDALIPRLDGADVVVPLRENALGVREVFVREPSGRILALSSAA